MIPPNPDNHKWLWVGWFTVRWTEGPSEVEKTRPDAIVLPRLVFLQDGPSRSILTATARSGPRFFVHRDLIDDA